jgi:hypothetical protein
VRSGYVRTGFSAAARRGENVVYVVVISARCVVCAGAVCRTYKNSATTSPKVVHPASAVSTATNHVSTLKDERTATNVAFAQKSCAKFDKKRVRQP